MFVFATTKHVDILAEPRGYIVYIYPAPPAGSGQRHWLREQPWNLDDDQSVYPGTVKHYVERASPLAWL
jgi:hypothetical protein